MKLQNFLLAPVFALAFVANANATSISYTDANTFAANSTGVSTVNFNSGFGQTYRGTTYTEDGVTFSASGGVFSIYGINYDAPYHQNGYLDLQGSLLGMSFGAPITALGFNFGGFYENPVLLNIGLSNGDSFIASTSAGYGFFGVTTDNPFSSISITTTNDFTAFDNVSYGAAAATVPEPTTVALLGLGLLGFAASRRKATKGKNT